MKPSSKPAALPDPYSGLWEALYRLNEKVGSRQRLSSILKVSTHTIQRILVDGDVPETGDRSSRRQSLAWARTLTRLAAGLEMDPLTLLEDIGFDMGDGMDQLVDSELVKLGSGETRPGSPVLTLAEVLMDVLGSQRSASAEPLSKALGRFIELNRRSSGLRATDEEISEGSYCRSCLASIEDHAPGSGDYCKWCGNEDGSLKPRLEVLEIMTDWFMSWQKGIDRQEAGRRAESYMQAMPAWNR
ncbi:MAG: hypothetical protein JXA64_05560 [Candidatus Fermentibacteraceae bacterium]|nr:hypothetical protein [Candidatus Fermentibacteraceae bacterium]MBN2608563.1 hypothetical protein [Candidatus Fermentibacteraceae bacterium]